MELGTVASLKIIIAIGILLQRMMRGNAVWDAELLWKHFQSVLPKYLCKAEPKLQQFGGAEFGNHLILQRSTFGSEKFGNCFSKMNSNLRLGLMPVCL